MKSNISRNIRLGIFISIGIAVFLSAVYFISEKQQLFRSTFRISGVFKDVAGLQAGNNVRLSGINVGTVDKVGIVSDTTVIVEILINESIRKYIKKDAVASIGSEGLMGNKILIINPGTGGKSQIEDNDTVETVQPVNIDNLMTSLKLTIDNASDITNNLALIASSIQSGKGMIGKLLMDQSMALNLDSSVYNLKLGSVGLKKLVDGAQYSFELNFDSTFVNMKEGSAGFNTLMAKAQKSFELNFDSTFVNIKEGSAGFNSLMTKARKSWLLWGF